MIEIFFCFKWLLIVEGIIIEMDFSEKVNIVFRDNFKDGIGFGVKLLCF